MLRFAVRFWRAQGLTFGQARGKRCATAPLLRKLRAPSVVEADSRKAWRAVSRGVRFDRRPSFLDLPAKGDPLLKVRVLESCRKSVAEKKRASSPADRPPRYAVLWSPRSHIAPKMPRLLDLLLCLTLKRQAEDKWLDHTRPTGFRGERWGRSARKRPLRNYAARGLMCRELHEPVIFPDPNSRKTKNAFQTIYFFQRFST